MTRQATLEAKRREQTQLDVPAWHANLAQLNAMAQNLTTLWDDPQTDVRQKKRIVRTVIREIVVDTDAPAGEIALIIQWQGGLHTQHKVRWRKRGQNRCHTSPDIVAAVADLARVCTDDLIASGLVHGHA